MRADREDDYRRDRGNGGRPKKLEEKKAAMARELRKDPNRTVKEICEVLKISRATFYNVTSEQKTPSRSAAA